jgi:hypothetical protein
VRPWPKRSPRQSKNKFGAQRTNGFASKLESAVHDLLKLFERGGEFSNIKCQPHVRLSRAGIGYKPDFSYTDNKTGETIWVEAKGAETEGYMIRKRLWASYGPGPLHIYKGDYRKPKMVEAIIPNRNLVACKECGSMIQSKAELK